jgi:osmotically-inducible protein OsmY
MTGAPTLETTTGLTERLGAALTANPHLFGRKLGYETDSGTVVLKGTVNSYFQKQMAQEAIRRVDGVEQIDNQLEVNWR